jgi:hypothetical protein
MSEKKPSEEALRQQLQLEWQDHIQTRTQTWKTLEIEAGLVLALIGIDMKFDLLWVALILGILVILSCISGIAITIHHRNGQATKFTHIGALEAALGLHQRGLINNVHPPARFKWTDIFNPKQVNTPLFILRTHIAILLFALVYLGVRVYTSFPQINGFFSIP